MIRVLIADDIAENRYLLETLLKGTGYDVTSAKNGAEALELARKDPPDVIITDILMPVMDGFTLCRQWKTDELLKNVPFVFYTATYTDQQDEKFALSLGAERFIVKPQKPEEMISILKEVLDRSRNKKPEPGEQPRLDDGEYLRDHNSTLLRKLEAKMAQLEQANASLTQEIVERALIEKELVYRNTILVTQQETSLDGILVVDGAGKIVSYNKRFVELWDVPTDIMTTQSDERALQSVLDKVEDPAGFHEKVKYLYEHKDETSRDLILLKDRRLFDRYSGPIIGDKGRCYGRVWYFRDITEQKRLEEQLRQAQKMEAIGALAGGIAHDFNNFLSAITGYACLLQKKTAPGSPNGHYVDQILTASKRAAVLTKSLLAFGRKQTGELRPVDLNEVVSGFQKMMGRIIGEDVEFAVECAGGPLPVLADAGQLEQVMMNLITNARDAMPRGGKLTITASLAPVFADLDGMKRGAYAAIAVTDTGHGIDKETQEHIFEPFFTTKETGKGTGLGLAITYGIVKNHQGFIGVESEPGKGTTFRIFLPLTNQALPTCRKEDNVLLRPGTETILLAEDDPYVRAVTGNLLREFGYSVLEAVDGEDAVNLFQDHADKVQLVLCDLIMPKKNGKETLQDMREIVPDLKAIFTSGYTADIIAKKGLLEEGAHFLPKPVSMMELIRMVREVLDA